MLVIQAHFRGWLAQQVAFRTRKSITTIQVQHDFSMLVSVCMNMETNIHVSIQLPNVANMISLCKYPSFHRKTIVIKCTFLIHIYLTDCCSPMSKPTL